MDQTNSLAINELGVLLARCGQLEDAAQVLTQGLSIAPQPQMWHNLAMIHEKLGNAALAPKDRRQRDALAAAQRAKGEELPASGLAAVRYGSNRRSSFAAREATISINLFGKMPRPRRGIRRANGSTPTQNTRSLIPNWIASEFKKSDGETAGGRSR